MKLQTMIEEHESLLKKSFEEKRRRIKVWEERIDEEEERIREEREMIKQMKETIEDCERIWDLVIKSISCFLSSVSIGRIEEEYLLRLEEEDTRPTAEEAAVKRAQRDKEAIKQSEFQCQREEECHQQQCWEETALKSSSFSRLSAHVVDILSDLCSWTSFNHH